MLIQTKTTTPTANNDRFTQEAIIGEKARLVESFKNFTAPALGITKKTNILEVIGDDKWKQTKAAILSHNFIYETLRAHGVTQGISALNETSRADLPKWIKTGLALISAGYAEDLTDLIISEQPLSSRSGRIHYMDIKTESNKGSLPGGQRIFDSLRGFYGNDEFTNHIVKEEPIGAAGSTNYEHTCQYLPAIPDTIHITDGTQVITDDRNGSLVGDVGTPSGIYNNKINYLTGLCGFVFAAATTGPVTVTYAYNIEAATELPRYGIALRSIEITAQPRALSAFWSQQAVFDFLNDFGIDAEPTILDAGAKIIMAEKFKHITKYLYGRANGGTMVFDNQKPTALTVQEHIDSFGILLTRLQNDIWQNTQRVRPNVCVFSPDIWFLFQYSKGFQGEGAPGQTDSLAGPKKAGVLTHHGMTCICDPTFKPKSALVTYRGNEMTNTAAICGNYIQLYKAPIHQRAFSKDTAMLTEYALHIINTEMLGRINVVNL